MNIQTSATAATYGLLVDRDVDVHASRPVSTRRAYGRARKTGGLAPFMIDRLWAATLMACNGRAAVTQAEMLRRTEHLFVLLRDSATWARGLPDWKDHNARRADA